MRLFGEKTENMWETKKPELVTRSCRVGEVQNIWIIFFLGQSYLSINC